MRYLAIIGLTFFLFFLTSCAPEFIHEEVYEFEDQSWQKFSDPVFEFDLEDRESAYALSVVYVINSNFVEESFNFKAVLDVGDQEFLQYFNIFDPLAIKDEIVVDPSIENRVEIPFLIFPQQYFNTEGPYELKLGCLMPKLYTKGIQRVEFKIKKIDG